jgi:hypothetical protein
MAILFFSGPSCAHIFFFLLFFITAGTFMCPYFFLFLDSHASFTKYLMHIMGHLCR